MLWFVLAFCVAILIAVYGSPYDKMFNFWAGWVFCSIFAALIGLGFSSSGLGAEWKNEETVAITGNVTLQTLNGENLYIFKTASGDTRSIKPKDVVVENAPAEYARYAVNKQKTVEWWAIMLKPFDVSEPVEHIYIPNDRFGLGS